VTKETYVQNCQRSVEMSIFGEIYQWYGEVFLSSIHYW